MKRLAVLALLFCVASAFPTLAAPPNVVVFLADDAGWGDFGASGNTNVKTPNIDSLAKAGASIDHFYVCALCAPTRAEFLTGRYHPRGGVRGVSTGQERLNTDEKTLADAFQKAGYATGAFGKWHNGSQWPYHPNARGFDEYYGFTSGHWGEYFDPPLDHNGRPVRGKGYVADDFTTHAIEFIERHRARPFLCYVAFNTPHSPWAVPQEYWRRFKDKPLDLRTAEGKEDLDQTRCALAMLENMDDNVGRLLVRLDELKLAQNTIVVFFSDNGPNTWRFNGGMKGKKGTVDEGGLRSVCFLRWPAQVAPGTRVDRIAGAVDLLPTLTALAGVKRVGDKPLDGRDLSPLLLGKEMRWPDRTLFAYHNGNISARSQQYRYDPRGGLFDMAADPGQKKNIAAEKPDVAERFAKAVADFRSSLPAKKGDDRPYPVGYAAFPRTPLPARDGVAHGGVKRSAGAPNCSYFVNWTKLDDSITWDIDVATAGAYEVEILYTCPLADAGATVELRFEPEGKREQEQRNEPSPPAPLPPTSSAERAENVGGRGELLAATLVGKVQPGWDPPLYTNQDTIARPAGESQMKPFRTLPLGTMRLEKGRGVLTLRAQEIPGKSVMDVRQVNLILKTNGGR